MITILCENIRINVFMLFYCIDLRVNYYNNFSISYINVHINFKFNIFFNMLIYIIYLLL